MTIRERLSALLAEGKIQMWQAPHKNFGLAGGLTPWVIVPYNFGPASTFNSDADLEAAVKRLETFGPDYVGQSLVRWFTMHEPEGRACEIAGQIASRQ